MNPERLLRAILPDVLIDNFDIVNFDKSADRFDIYLDEKKIVAIALVMGLGTTVAFAGNLTSGVETVMAVNDFTGSAEISGW